MDNLLKNNSFLPSSLSEIAKIIECNIDQDLLITGFSGLEFARPDQLSFCDNIKYIHKLKVSLAGACLITEKMKEHIPHHMIALVVKNPQSTFIDLTRLFFAKQLVPKSIYAETSDFFGVTIHDDAEIEHNVIIDPGVIIGKDVIIGSGTQICGGAIIGSNVTIGRDCSIGAHVTLQNCHIGNRVIIHPGVKIGQDGFGYRFKNGAHEKIPQIGRVVIQDDVDIGANCTIDRGSIRDTVIGEGTKIDNLVQIAHNVIVGRHCIIISFVGLAGSCTIEDNVIISGFVSVNNNITIGEGAVILPTSAVKDDVPKKARYGGTPAKPFKDLFREIAAIEKLGKASRGEKESKNNE